MFFFVFLCPFATWVFNHYDIRNSPLLMVKMHSHSHTNDSSKLLWIICLLLTFFSIEVIGGFITSSLALLSDAAHMFTDIIALFSAWVAFKVSSKPIDMKKTFGYYRFEILAAAFNTLLLFATALYIVYEALDRLYHPESIHSQGMLLIGLIGLIINIIALKILSDTHHQDNLNFKSAYLEVISDLLSSVGVVIAAVFIYFFHYAWIDSVIALLIACWVIPRSWIIFRDSMEILLESVPKDIKTQEVYHSMKAIPGVLNIHDLHIWSITKQKIHLTAHVIIQEENQSSLILNQLQEILHEKFKIRHTTLQLETQECFEKTQH
jgi:cobalt-zinc-cadmium efflux system protein